MAGNSTSRVMCSGTVKTYQVSADSTALSGKVMKDNAGKVTVSAAATSKPVGILVEVASAQTTANAGVCTSGPCYALAGGTIGENDWVTSDASGNLVATITKGDYWVGRALEDAASGDFFEIDVQVGQVGTYV